MKKLIPALFVVSVLFVSNAHAETSVLREMAVGGGGALGGCVVGAAGTGITMSLVGNNGPDKIVNGSIKGCYVGGVVGGLGAMAIDEAYAGDAPSEQQLSADEE